VIKFFIEKYVTGHVKMYNKHIYPYTKVFLVIKKCVLYKPKDDKA